MLNKMEAALIKAFVDDYFIHAMSKIKLCQVLTTFMDRALECGFLCHPGKLEQPNRIVKYVGFQVDMISIPCL